MWPSHLEIPPPRPAALAMIQGQLTPTAQGPFTLPELCAIAGIPCKATLPRWYRVWLDNMPHSYTLVPADCLYYDYLVAESSLGPYATESELAARVIEVLAYGFFEMAARETARGLFR